MEDKVTIQKENLLSAYKEASEAQKALLENLFGKETFQLITERVKTFDDAYKILGDEHPLTIQYRLIIKASKGGDLTIALIAYPIMNSSLTNSIVLDPFGGSGSTLIASEQTDRICYMIELDEKYCDVIAKRYIEQVGTDEDVYVIRNNKRIAYSELEVSESA